MPQVCVSSYCLRQHLGPIHLMRRGPDGRLVPFVWGEPLAQSMTIFDLPAQVKARLGLDAVEVCQFHLAERTPACLERLRGALDAADVSLVNMPIDVGNVADPNPAYREEDLAEIEAWMRAAAALGSRMVRVNAGPPFPADVAPAVVVDSFQRLADTAAALGLQLLLENHGGITTDPEMVVRIVEAVGPARLKTLVDIGNFEPLLTLQRAVRQGQPRPEVDVEPVYHSIARLAPYAGLVHAKTHEFDAQGRARRLDVVRALRVIRAAGYTGPVSLEYEGSEGDPWENTRRTLALVEEAFA